MALARDASSGSNDGSGTATSLTYAHTCTGTNLVLIVGAFLDNDTTDTITGITYNSVALTKINGVSGSSDQGYSTLWYLIAPATGANNIVVSWTGANNISSCAISYTGAHQTSPIDSNNTGTNGGGSTLTLATTVVASDCWLVTTGTSLDDSLSANTGMLDVANDDRGVMHMGDSDGTVGTGSQSVIWNIGSRNGGNVISLAPILTTISLSVSESITVTDTPVMNLVVSVNKSESITVTESIDLDLYLDINLSDSITVTDTPTVFFPFLAPDKSEAITVTDTPVMNLEVKANISEAITVTETVTTDLEVKINVSESITVTDSPIMNLETKLNVSESITLTESLTMNLLLMPQPSESIIVTDTSSVRRVRFAPSTNWTPQTIGGTDWTEVFK